MGKTIKKMKREPREPRSEVAFMAIFERKGGPMKDRRVKREREDERSILRRGVEDYENGED